MSFYLDTLFQQITTDKQFAEEFAEWSESVIKDIFSVANTIYVIGGYVVLIGLGHLAHAIR